MSQYPNRDARPRETDMAKAVKFAAKQAVLTGVRTLIPGLVESYDPATKRAVVQPIVKQSFIDGTSKARAPLIDVPVVQPSTSGYMIHIQIGEGDILAVAFTQTGLETFKRIWGNGDPVEPVEPVPASAFADCIAWPWGVPNMEPVSTEGIVLQSADGETYIHLKDGMIELKCGEQGIRMTPQRGDFI